MHPRLVRYAKRRVDADAAMDVAAQTLQTIWSKDMDAPSDDDTDRQLQSLAYRIAEEHLRSLHRVQDRSSLVTSPATETAYADRSELDDIADLVVAPEGAQWLTQLSFTDREVLALVADGYTVSEIAVILDCSAATVSMRLQRAKRNLKLILGRRSLDG